MPTVFTLFIFMDKYQLAKSNVKIPILIITFDVNDTISIMLHKLLQES